jgi:hypothetical protein
MTFVSSVHNPKIMLSVLVKVLCSHSITTRRRLPREGNVTFEDLMGGASNFDVRTVTIEGLTSVRYALSVAALAAVGLFGRQELALGLLLLPGVGIGYATAPLVARFLDRRRLRIAILTISGGSAVALLVR